MMQTDFYGSDHKFIRLDLLFSGDDTTSRLQHHVEVDGENDPPPVGTYGWSNALCEHTGYECLKRALDGDLKMCMRHGGGPRCQGTDGKGCEYGNGALNGDDLLCARHGGGNRCVGWDGKGCEYDNVEHSRPR